MKVVPNYRGYIYTAYWNWKTNPSIEQIFIPKSYLIKSNEDGSKLDVEVSLNKFILFEYNLKTSRYHSRYYYYYIDDDGYIDGYADKSFEFIGYIRQGDTSILEYQKSIPTCLTYKRYFKAFGDKFGISYWIGRENWDVKFASYFEIE